MNPTEKLARYIAETSYDDLPKEAVEAAKVAILDGVANVLAGSTLEVAQKATKYVQNLGGNPTSTIFGRNIKSNAFFAAFANGVALHCMDYEIQGQPPSHGTSSILPPALALAEERGNISGQDLVLSYTIGWDIQQRIRTAAAKANLRGFHPPGVFGPMGSAAAASKILGLDTQQVRTALGIAASRTGGLFANNGTMVKATHPGNAARMGVESVLLAEDGYVSNDSIMDAHQGYVSTLFGKEFFDWDLLFEDLGKKFHIADPGFNIKRYPAEIYMQWAINATADLREKHGVTLDNLESLVMELPAFDVHLSRPRPASGLDGKFSFEYCSVLPLVNEHVGIDSFSDETRFSPEMEQALDKVSLEWNPEIPANAVGIWIDAKATLKDGTKVTERCRHYRGSIANPMSHEEHVVKYEDCVKRVLSADDMNRLREIVETLETQSSLDELIGLLATEPAAQVR